MCVDQPARMWAPTTNVSLSAQRRSPRGARARPRRLARHKLTLKTTPAMVVPVFFALGSLPPPAAAAPLAAVPAASAASRALSS